MPTKPVTITPPPFALHVQDAVFHAEPHPLDIYRHHPVEIGLFQVGGKARNENAAIVEREIEGSIGINNLLHERLNLIGPW